MAVNAMRLGAYDFVEKPFPPDRLVEMGRRAAENRRLILQVRALRANSPTNAASSRQFSAAPQGSGAYGSLCSTWQAYPQTFSFRERRVPARNLVARSLHQHSPRSSKPFVAVNCGGMPDQLFESEMFGYEPGSFTNASHRRIGKFQHANGGTLFLDEIESTPVALQVKLLRVLQDQKVDRLGSNEWFAVDVRVIAASKGNLKQLAEQRHFRTEDIPLLFEHFVVNAARRHYKPMPVITAPQLKELLSYDWPGNVRELRNVADRFVLGLLDESVSVLSGRAFPKVSLGNQIHRFERVLIEDALAEHHGNATLVCRSLGIPKRTLYDKMRKLGLSTEEFHASDARGRRS
jgi:two-component system C4-dicarboxylate transport response regulator DctD